MDGRDAVATSCGGELALAEEEGMGATSVLGERASSGCRLVTTAGQECREVVATQISATSPAASRAARVRGKY
jgi:hypothetical protein